jgi:kojibiose phosphorylase
MDHNWLITESEFLPTQQQHAETIFTIGNGYLCTRGAFEEGFLGDHRASFIHGIFDATPLAFTELVNAPDWLPLTVRLNGERFDLTHGTVEGYRRTLNLRNGVLTRTVVWKSPSGHRVRLTFERFASLADPHALFLRCRVVPEFQGTLEFRAGINGRMDNLGLTHWQFLDQGARGEVVYLHQRTLQSKIETGYGLRVTTKGGRECAREFWDVEGTPTLMVRVDASSGEEVILEKQTGVYTSRDVPASEVVAAAVRGVTPSAHWEKAFDENAQAWEEEWARGDVTIEGDALAQLVVRFNIYALLIAAPRHDDHVSIGAKTLSGFGYRGHVFWDTEIFMLPLFTYTAPHIARNLLNYRYARLGAAREKAKKNGYEGAQFAWESADTGEEVTPTWLPYYADPTRLVRIWTGDIEIHISADIAYAAHQYWRLTGDDAWLVEKGAELILDTAKFWASRAEWHAEAGRYEYNDVIGPDEYHEHVNNNFYTNRMAQWNLQTALDVLNWLEAHVPAQAEALRVQLDLDAARLTRWRDVIAKMYLPVASNGLVEQFTGYLQRKDVNLAALEPRMVSVQQVFGIEGTNATQALKQPDVLMLFFLLRGQCAEPLRVNYDYYTPRTDYSYGSSLGPAIGAIMACEVGDAEVAYEQFMRGARADLYDVRGNAGDGIHGASAGGVWQAVLFGFAGLRVTPEGWTTQPRLPKNWTRVAFKFFHRGQLQQVEVKP